MTNTSVSELQEKYNFLIYNIHQGEGSGLRSSRCRQTTEQSRSSLSESRKIRRSRKVKLYLHKYLEIEYCNFVLYKHSLVNQNQKTTRNCWQACEAVNGVISNCYLQLKNSSLILYLTPTKLSTPADTTSELSRYTSLNWARTTPMLLKLRTIWPLPILNR